MVRLFAGSPGLALGPIAGTMSWRIGVIGSVRHHGPIPWVQTLRCDQPKLERVPAVSTRPGCRATRPNRRPADR